ncbi:MAG TPA: NADH-quinone oxidoreductase subunit L [Thermoplasmata archaeon]|nr:NADH-quinone oxidoreductase subunit L [Thermoplasmata archaeon]
MSDPFSGLFPYAFLVPLFPALAFVVIGLFGTWLKKLEWGGWVAVGAAGLALLVALLIAAGEAMAPGQFTDVHTLVGSGASSGTTAWLFVPGNGMGAFPNGFTLAFGTLVDPISALMLVVVNVVGFLVMLYSIGYMHRDKGLPRYYAELSLFLTAMNGLVLSDNLFEFFLFWELVGVCSYFLIGFYYERPAAASAAKEAFLVTRVGDVLFLLGVFLYFVTYATAGPAGSGGWAYNGFLFVNGNAPYLGALVGTNSPTLTIAGLMMLAGAAGKSAQFPLHVWLPDAMEGPTTVSALIHAATMVAAGVYLLAVTSLFLGFTPTDQLAIVAIGGFTAFFAATHALVNPDIKRVIAYSTISQLGYMVLAIGAGFTMVGLFHLFTHAFFKALLFLAAGSVIHAVGTQDLFKMGGLGRRMRVTMVAFAVGGLALAGVPPFAGFWSKDDVLASVLNAAQAHPLYWPFFAFALVTVFLTGYYIFRAFFLAFSGPKPRDPMLPEPHESPWTMRLPLLVLSALAIVGGFLVFDPGFANLLPGVGIPPTYTSSDLLLSGVSTALAVGGIGLAYGMWANGKVFTLAPDSAARPWRTLLLRRYYFKFAFDWVGVRAVYSVARAADFVDRYVIDGTVHGFERAFGGASRRLRAIQTGVVSDYAAYVVSGLVVVLVLLLFVAPWVATHWGA